MNALPLHPTPIAAFGRCALCAAELPCTGPTIILNQVRLLSALVIDAAGTLRAITVEQNHEATEEVFCAKCALQVPGLDVQKFLGITGEQRRKAN